MSKFIHKRYDYLFTGHNTEILDFDLSYDSIFLKQTC